MNLNTSLVQRLRGALVQSGRLASDAATSAQQPAGPDVHDTALERIYPFAETLYLVMMIDGEADAAELDAIRGAIRILSNGLLADSALDAIFERCRERAAQRGAGACWQEIGALLSSDRLDRETAFTLAAAVAMADDELRNAESALIGDICEWFGISNKRAQVLLQDA